LLQVLKSKAHGAKGEGHGAKSSTVEQKGIGGN
jgi:hypothetical protein